MIHRLSLLALFAFVTACNNESAPRIINDADLIVRCGAVIDGIASEPTQNQLIVIREQRISEILPGDDPSLSSVDALDLSELTCLPGLIDTHVHLDGVPDDYDDTSVYLRRTPAETAAISENLAGVVINSGFTTVRHVGSYKAWVDRDLRERIESGDVVGPRIRIGGPYLTIPHGGGDMYIPGVDDSDVPDYYREGVARGPEEFRARAQEIVDGGADFLKIIASGAVFGLGSDPGAPEMTPEEIAAVVEVADAAGIKVTAHAHSAESIKDAILAGVSSIEHASFGNDESVALALEHNVAFSMDVYNGTYTENVGAEKGYAEEFMEKNRATTETQRVVFEKAVAAGVTVMFGTDLGVLPHDMGAWQFSIMVERGMTAMQAIMAATSVAAKHMNMDKDVGAIEIGRYADLIAVKGNPLDNIAALRHVDVVIKGGVIVKKTSER